MESNDIFIRFQYTNCEELRCWIKIVLELLNIINDQYEEDVKYRSAIQKMVVLCSSQNASYKIPYDEFGISLLDYGFVDRC